MNRLSAGRFFSLCFITCLLSSCLFASTPHAQRPALVDCLTQPIPYDDVINAGLTYMRQSNTVSVQNSPFTELIAQEYTELFILKQWYIRQKCVDFASIIHNTLTIKFTDETYYLVINPSINPRQDNSMTWLINNRFSDYQLPSTNPSQMQPAASKTAILLNPSQYLYGNAHCKPIINMLQRNDFQVSYYINSCVNLSVIQHKLAANIVYMNTHAGFWDITGDTKPDAVVIATGEAWTDETMNQYPFEYNNSMIVRARVGEKTFVCFTPALIQHYYQNNTFPGSLIYMATCHATYDDSMAQSFLSTGASSYIGWTNHTTFWTNQLVAILAFTLLTRGYTVQQICTIIRYGGFLNRRLHSTLTYYGQDDLSI